jgi:hypothetical protein
VSSLTERVSSRLFFCLFRKRKAMLNGLGSFPARVSMWDGGEGVRGGNLRPGPESCYLSGDDMQAIGANLWLGLPCC